MITISSAIARISGSCIRPQERNLLVSSFNRFLYTLHKNWTTTTDTRKETAKERKEGIATEIVYVCRKLLRLLDEKIFPFVTIDVVVIWMKLKLKCFEYIYQVSGNGTVQQEAQMNAKKVRQVIEEVYTTHELLDFPPCNPILLRVTVNYCKYCNEVLQIPMRAFRIGTKILESALIELQKAKTAEQTQLADQLKAYLDGIQESRIIHKQKCSRVIKQGYLRKKEATSAELSMPMWVVFGYSDFHTVMLVYNSIESEEANEIFLSPDVLPDQNEKGFTVTFPSGTTWYTNSPHERDEWCSAVENTQKSQGRSDLPWP